MQRFPKTARIRCADEFQRVREQGVRFSAGRITVAAASGSEKRLGVVVSRKVGGAVQRNRIKRTIREMFRGNQEEFPHGDCVVVAHVGAAKLDNASIRRAMSLALGGLAKRAGGRRS